MDTKIVTQIYQDDPAGFGKNQELIADTAEHVGPYYAFDVLEEVTITAATNSSNLTGDFAAAVLPVGPHLLALQKVTLTSGVMIGYKIR